MRLLSLSKSTYTKWTRLDTRISPKFDTDLKGCFSYSSQNIFWAYALSLVLRQSMDFILKILESARRDLEKFSRKYHVLVMEPL